MSEKKISLNLSHWMKEKSFDSFKDLRKESSAIIREYHDSFMKIACQRFGIIYPDDIRRRDFMALMEKHNAQIVKNEDNHHDELIIDGEVVAYWNRDYALKFDKGNLICEILIFIKE